MNILLISLQKDLDVIGLKYLHYYLMKNHFNSYLLHLPNVNPNKANAFQHISKFVLEIDPKLIGISLMSVEYLRARGLTKFLKNNFKSIPTIWGGIHPTISPESCVDHSDYVCIGEGERTILDLANAINKDEDIKAIKNLCYTENGRLKRNPLYPLIENLGEIPSYDHIPLNSFIQEKDGRIVPIDKNIFKRYARYRGTIYSVISSRGCPFSCTYCCNNLTSRLYQSKKVRRRSIKDTILELEKAVNDHPEIEYINFQDDCFLACSNEFLKEFCESYKERVRRPFIARSIAIYITREKVRSLKDAGLAWISLGLQSGSDYVCKEIYKRKSLQADFIRATGIIKDFNIAAFYDVILDNPFENEEAKLETVQTLVETPKPFYAQFFSLTLYLGTELYERAKRECPEKIEDSLTKNNLVYRENVLNELTRLAVFQSKQYMNKLIHLYKQNPKGFRLKINLLIAKSLSLIIFEPLAYYRVIKLSQGGSFLRALKVLPNYFKEGFMRYLNQFGSSGNGVGK